MDQGEHSRVAGGRRLQPWRGGNKESGVWPLLTNNQLGAWGLNRIIYRILAEKLHLPMALIHKESFNEVIWVAVDLMFDW